MTSTIPSWQGLDLAGGRYHVTGRLGGGGMAEVFKAWDRNLQTEVVIKVPLPHLLRNPTFAARFSREVNALVRLAHPHIVKVLDVGDNAGTPFAVMQYLSGDSLRQRQIGSGRVIQALPPASLTSWLEGVAEALDFLHAQGFVHRDVKPGNILFDAHGNAYLSDFGIIKALTADGEPASNLTQQGTVLGTLQYLAPEVLLGRRYDGRVDQFAVAVTVYEILTGRYPFQGTTPVEIMGQQVTTRPTPPHELVPGILEPLSRAVLRGLAYEPAERFPDCASFARAVLPAVASRPATAGASVAPPSVRQLACPLCQELFGLTAAHGGQRIRCPSASCQAELLVSTDLSRVTVAARSKLNLTLNPVPPVEQPPAPQNFDLQPASEALPDSTMPGISLDEPAAEQVQPAQPYNGTLKEGALVGGAHWASPPSVLPDGLFIAEEVAPPPAPRGRGFKVLALGCLCLILLGGGGFISYHAWRYFQAHARSQAKADNTEPNKPGQRRRLIVDPKGGEYYPTVTEALADAPANATILIRPGLYQESVVLDRAVKLVGDGPADQIILEGAPCVRMKADRGLLRGLTLRGKAGAKNEPAVDIPEGKLVMEDCDISAEGQAGVAISGPLASPVLHQCKIHDCQAAGILIDTNAAGRLEACEVFGNAGPGVEVRGGAAPELRKCTLRDGKDTGLLVHQAGRGTFEDCEVFGNVKAGVVIKDRGSPTLKNCKLRDGQDSGLLVTTRGQGLLKDCEVFGNAGAGVVVENQGDPTLRRCKVYNGKREGLVFQAGGLGTVEDCTITGNTLAGFSSQSGGKPTARHCTMAEGKNVGVLFFLGGAGTLVDCRISNNALSGVEIRDAQSDPTLQQCKVFANEWNGVNIHSDGKGTLDDCDIYGNALAVLKDLVAGVRVASGAEPLVLGGKIHDNVQAGVLFDERAKGKLKRCSIYGNNKAGVAIKTATAVVVEGCYIYGGKDCGILVQNNGTGTFIQCDIYENTLSGIAIQSGGDPLVKHCTIRDGKQCGILSLERGKGRIQNCSISGNAFAGVETRERSKVFLLHCKINHNLGPGIKAHRRGFGTVRDCDLTNNTGGATKVDRTTSKLIGRGNTP